ncbi:MAG: hypothetical protein ACTHJW_00820, partial [Streptosporangiaceae bacterium]
MPADSAWQNQAGRPSRGPGPRPGGYGPPGQRRARPWPPDADYGYAPGAAAPQTYGSGMRDGYAAADVRYQNQPGGYAAGRPVPSDQGTGRDRRDRSAEPWAERGQPAEGAGQSALAGKTGQKRRTGPPAALPPGPSASRTQGAESELASEGPQSQDLKADLAARNERRHPAGLKGQADLEPLQRAADPAGEPGAAHADAAAAGSDASAAPAQPAPAPPSTSAPPSPTGTIPPAVIEVPNSAPPVH